MLDGDHGLALEERTKDDGTAEAKDDKGHENTAPVEGEDGSLLGWFVGDDGLSGHGTEEILDQVGRVEDTHLLNAQCREDGEVGEVVVDEGNHTVGGVDFRV